MKHMVRLSFDIPEDVHILLKSGCAQARITIKDYLNSLIEKGVEDLETQNLHKRLESSLKQSKEGKVVSRGSFAKYAEDEV